MSETRQQQQAAAGGRRAVKWHRGEFELHLNGGMTTVSGIVSPGGKYGIADPRDGFPRALTHLLTGAAVSRQVYRLGQLRRLAERLEAEIPQVGDWDGSCGVDEADKYRELALRVCQIEQEVGR